MNCKFCDAPLEEENPICPACGVDNNDTDPQPHDTPITQEERSERDEDLYEDSSLYEAAESMETPAPTEATPPPKRASKGLLICLVVVALAAVAALILAFAGILGTKDDGTDPTEVNMVDQNGAFIAHDFIKAEMTAPEATAVVATADKQKLTNADLSFYYWQQYYGLYNSYGMYISMILDPEQSLAVQMYDETHSWQDKLLQAAITAFHQSVALESAAKKAGFTLTEEHTSYIDSMADSLAQEAETNGYASADALLQSVYGPYATMEGYLQYARTTMLGSNYLQSLFDTIVYTDEDVTKYFDENPTAFEGMSKDDPNMVAVRHILITPEAAEDAQLDEAGAPILSDADWAKAESTANEIYAQWQAGDATEASFSALAAEHSADGSAQQGGLIEDVRPGQMVPEFDAWCFESGRKTGDHSVVKTEFGYHIIYFSAMGDHPYWFTQAESALVQSLQEAMMNDMMDKVKIKVDYSKVVLVEAATEEVAPDETTPEATAPEVADPETPAP